MSSKWTLADVRAVQARHTVAAPPPLKKYRNHETVVDGITFDSKKEAEHYLLLKMRERLGEINTLDLQPVFEIYIDTQDRGRIRIGNFTADFRYWERQQSPDNDVLRVVDVKSPVSRTTAYQLRKRLVEAIYNITIMEV